MLQEHELRVTQKKYGKNNSLFYFDSQNANLPRVLVLCFFCVTGDSVYNICLTSISTVLFLMEQFLKASFSSNITTGAKHFASYYVSQAS